MSRSRRGRRTSWTPRARGAHNTLLRAAVERDPRVAGALTEMIAGRLDHPELLALVEQQTRVIGILLQAAPEAVAADGLLATIEAAQQQWDAEQAVI